MKPSRIKEILDLALTARNNNLVFNPMFVGEAGLGKSEIIRQWVAEQDEKFKDDGGFQFIDLRLAYYEGPDFIGYPFEFTDENNIKRMGHALPHFWPTSGRGLILLEEPNRGNTMIMNCCMQLLTDRMVGPNYKLPDGWIIAGAMNPDTSNYDVSSMDTALADRFEFFNVEYDFNTFLDYIQENNWHPNIVNFIKSGLWVYKKPDAIADKEKYIAPRTWSKMNTAELSGVGNDQNLHHLVCRAILGNSIGSEYWQACWNNRPVLAQDLILDEQAALNKIKEYSKSGKLYAGDKVALTIESIIENYNGWYEGKLDSNGHKEEKPANSISEETMVKVAKIIPSDQAVTLIRGCLLKQRASGGMANVFKSFYQRNKECIDIMKDNIKFDTGINNRS